MNVYIEKNPASVHTKMLTVISPPLWVVQLWVIYFLWFLFFFFLNFILFIFLYSRFLLVIHFIYFSLAFINISEFPNWKFLLFRDFLGAILDSQQYWAKIQRFPIYSLPSHMYSLPHYQHPTWGGHLFIDEPTLTRHHHPEVHSLYHNSLLVLCILQFWTNS